MKICMGTLKTSQEELKDILLNASLEPVYFYLNCLLIATDFSGR